MYEKICDIENIRLAYKNAKLGKSHYHEVKQIETNVDYYLLGIQKSFINRTYKTSEYKIFILDEGRKNREIYKLPFYPDRIAQWAIMQILSPIFIKNFISSTHATINGRGIHSAFEETARFMMDKEGTEYCLKLDIKKYFININQTILKTLIRKKIKDKDVLNILDEIIGSVDRGVPIGNYSSQFLANFYLSGLDHFAKEHLHIKYYTRYMDDIVIFSNSKEHLHFIFEELKIYIQDKLDLEFKSNYQIFPTRVRGLDFVGYRNFGDGYILMRKDTSLKMKRKMNKIKNKDLLNLNDLGAFHSYLGWIKVCNNKELYHKYFQEIERRITYEENNKCAKYGRRYKQNRNKCRHYIHKN